MLFIPNYEIKNIALEVGFQNSGISKAAELANEKAFLEQWLQSKFHAELHYMENHFEKRINPCLLADNVKSVISVILSYNPQEEILGDLKIAKYAYGPDYHFVMKEMLYKMISLIQVKYPDFSAIPFVDSAPVMEKAWAAKAGLGWIGKNTCLINPEWGSFCFIGELLCNATTEYDTAIKSRCGNCTNCLQGCPNKALEEPYVLNCNKCISYHTIENRSNELPNNLSFNNYIFGCDICQNNCPWNKKALKNNTHFPFTVLPTLKESLSTGSISNLNKAEYKKLVKNSALSRAPYLQFIRNIDIQKQH